MDEEIKKKALMQLAGTDPKHMDFILGKKDPVIDFKKIGTDLGKSMGLTDVPMSDLPGTSALFSDKPVYKENPRTGMVYKSQEAPFAKGGAMDASPAGMMGTATSLATDPYTYMGGIGGGVKALVNPAKTAFKYLKAKGMPFENYGKVDVPKLDVNPQRAEAIASAYDALEHAPNNPEVRKAYDALINETIDQWKAIEKSGLKVSPIGKDMKNPYKDSAAMIQDVKHNNNMYYYPTEQGFGSGAANLDHPMLRPSGVKINGREVPANDLFRIVHDYFGHSKDGFKFGAKGEENAWNQHMKMYSPEAQKALTTETRGQNSWVNYGPEGAANRANPANTKYADQKAGILPDWAHETGQYVPPTMTAAEQKAVLGELPKELQPELPSMEPMAPVSKDQLDLIDRIAKKQQFERVRSMLDRRKKLRSENIDEPTNILLPEEQLKVK